MKNQFAQFAEWGRIGGRMNLRRLLKAKNRKPKKRGVGRPKKDIKYTPIIDKRALEFKRLFTKEHRTLAEIGKQYDLTRERVRQILKRQNITGVDGGKQAITTPKKIEREILKRSNSQNRLENTCFKLLGCSIDIYEHLTGEQFPKKFQRLQYKTACGYYLAQKYNAKTKRKITWNLTFPQWWLIWQESGHWEQRGRGQDHYVMCRYGDSDGYAIGNVFIASSVENNSDRSNKKSGLPTGVSKSKSKYQVQKMIDGVVYYIGRFDTPEAAHEAYLNFKPKI